MINRNGITAINLGDKDGDFLIPIYVTNGKNNDLYCFYS